MLLVKNYLRKRSGSRDFASNRAAKPADSKKSAKVASGSSSSRRDSLTRSSSASSLATTITRSAHAAQRKNSLDACSTASHSHNRAANGTLDAVGGSASAVRAVPEPLQPISDAEAVRRFILQDIKHVSGGTGNWFLRLWFEVILIFAVFCRCPWIDWWPTPSACASSKTFTQSARRKNTKKKHNATLVRPRNSSKWRRASERNATRLEMVFNLGFPK